uniref:Uncharacterized protein n=1 Tax=Trachysalambria curvirostris majanivirus TaxID=2984281 RepID=A0A9C7BIK8_9VIRU|nr:MAG: hypothetical protein [Trachysalambria curvirostris majanivirus]
MDSDDFMIILNDDDDDDDFYKSHNIKKKFHEETDLKNDNIKGEEGEIDSEDDYNREGEEEEEEEEVGEEEGEEEWVIDEAREEEEKETEKEEEEEREIKNEEEEEEEREIKNEEEEDSKNKKSGLDLKQRFKRKCEFADENIKSFKYRRGSKRSVMSQQQKPTIDYTKCKNVTFDHKKSIYDNNINNLLDNSIMKSAAHIGAITISMESLRQQALRVQALVKKIMTNINNLK